MRRICSCFIDFLYFSNLLYVQLLKRNYNAKILNGIIRSVSKIERDNLLPYKKNQNSIDFNNSFKLFFKYDYTNSFFRNYFYQDYIKLKNDYEF